MRNYLNFCDETTDEILKNLKSKEQNMPISWKTNELEFDYNSQIVKATVKWWAKDYCITVHEPKQLNINGPHMMYMIPAYFIWDNQSPKLGSGKPVLIKENCKNLIINKLNEIKD